MILAAALLAVALAIVGYFIRDDRRQMARFKALDTSAARQRQFRIWTAKAFAIFVGATLGGLALLGRLDTLTAFPHEFVALSARVPLIGKDISGAFGGFVIGAMIGGSVLAVLLSRRSAKGKEGAPPMLGDVAVILPRNRAELAHGAVLSLNAGLTEELFFRLLLPLLIAILTGNAVLAFVAATIVFGLVHLYQGWIGVVATTVLGALLAVLYIGTGSLLVPIVAHVLIDLNALVLRPALSGAWRR